MIQLNNMFEKLMHEINLSSYPKINLVTNPVNLRHSQSKVITYSHIENIFGCKEDYSTIEYPVYIILRSGNDKPIYTSSDYKKVERSIRLDAIKSIKGFMGFYGITGTCELADKLHDPLFLSEADSDLRMLTYKLEYKIYQYTAHPKHVEDAYDNARESLVSIVNITEWKNQLGRHRVIEENDCFLYGRHSTSLTKRNTIIKTFGSVAVFRNDNDDDKCSIQIVDKNELENICQDFNKALNFLTITGLNRSKQLPFGFKGDTNILLIPNALLDYELKKYT